MDGHNEAVRGMTMEPEQTAAEVTETFSKMGKTYQEKVVQALLQDYQFAEQMADVLQPKYFDLKYLQEIVQSFYDHKNKYKTYPSPDILDVMLTRQDDSTDAVVNQQVREYLDRSKKTPLNGDKGFIEESSLEFCKKQSLKDGLMEAINMMESGKFDSIQSVIKDALNKGGARDLGHDYNEGFDYRSKRSIRKPISTGWPTVDKEFNGGWERQTLTTFIGGTGSGKSMFLVNCSAAGVAQGLNVLYVTLEMADYKIGLRHDSYFSGIEINNVPDHKEKVEADVRGAVKGRLMIKEFATKTATVQTLRAYIQRLVATKGFVPDMVVVDYADLMRGSRSYGDHRFELAGVYEELRALAQELNVVLITADQTNRGGMNEEIVTLSSIAESFAKATVCDVIITISRRMEDKQSNMGRLFIAKSRLGRDGIVLPFTLNTATVKVTVLQHGDDPIAMFMENNQNRKEVLADRYNKLISGKTGTADK